MEQICSGLFELLEIIWNAREQTKMNMKIYNLDFFLIPTLNLSFVKIFISSLLFLQGGFFIDLNARDHSLQDGRIITINGRQYITHIVQPGEGLHGIGARHGLTVKDLLDANPDISSNIKVGQIVRIPVVLSNTTAHSLPGNYFYHTVETGQTVFSISRQHDVTVDEIYRLNPGSREGIVKGSVLKIPAAAKNETVSRDGANTRNSQNRQFIMHVVQARETLFGISRQYNVTVDEIVAQNPTLQAGILDVGEEIRIPRPPAGNGNPASGLNQTVANNSRRHTVLQGQTLFSISQQYQLPLAILLSANPGIDSNNLKVGTVLLIPTVETVQGNATNHVIENRQFITHRVRRNETLFGIARRYGVTIESIQQANPGVNFQALTNGIILRVPTSNWNANQVAENNMQQVVRQPGETVSPAQAGLGGDCIPNRKIGYTEPIKVALLLPFAAPSNIVNDYTESDTANVKSGARLAEGRSKDFVEFYGGMLIALDSLKKRGISVTLSVYDIASNSNAGQFLSSNPSLKESHLIIGPAFAQELPAISAFSRENQIPLVFPLSNTNPALRANPYLFHVNSPDSLLFSRMADEITMQANGAKLIVLMPPATESQANNLVNIIRSRANSDNTVASDIVYAEFRSEGDDFAHLQTLLSTERPNVVVVPSVNTAEVSRIIPLLYGARVNTGANVKLFGMSDWLRFSTIEPEHVHALNTTIFTLFGIDYTLYPTRAFLQKYRSWFHTEPHAVSPYFHRSDASSGFSRYGIWGFDVAHYFISAIAEHGANFYNCLPVFMHDEVQFNFNFRRISSSGGFFNDGMYMLRFHPNFMVERIPLK